MFIALYLILSIIWGGNKIKTNWMFANIYLMGNGMLTVPCLYLTMTLLKFCLFTPYLEMRTLCPATASCQAVSKVCLESPF